jgi:hypothetical protein
MSKNKTKPKKRVIVKSSSPKGSFDKDEFLLELDRRVKRLINSSLLPIEQRLTLLFERIQNVKANVIASNTLLERNGVINKEEFYREFLVHEEMEVGGVDSLGKMNGNPVFSLYGIGD